MPKYWNPRRIRNVRERKILAKRRDAEREDARKEQMRSYTRGDVQKNAQLMLAVLGMSLRRRIVALLRREGAMSVSKLAKPFRLTLPSALDHVHILERSGIITTHKQGRIRMCVYNERAIRELTQWLLSDGLKRIK